jgi:hypothetical protein
MRIWDSMSMDSTWESTSCVGLRGEKVFEPVTDVLMKWLFFLQLINSISSIVFDASSIKARDSSVSFRMPHFSVVG